MYVFQIDFARSEGLLVCVFVSVCVCVCVRASVLRDGNSLAAMMQDFMMSSFHFHSFAFQKPMLSWFVLME